MPGPSPEKYWLPLSQVVTGARAVCYCTALELVTTGGEGVGERSWLLPSISR
jgi:hypothetical protein